jgi:hypothetical protein
MILGPLMVCNTNERVGTEAKTVPLGRIACANPVPDLVDSVPVVVNDYR